MPNVAQQPTLCDAIVPLMMMERAQHAKFGSFIFFHQKSASVGLQSKAGQFYGKLHQEPRFISSLIQVPSLESSYQTLCVFIYIYVYNIHRLKTPFKLRFPPAPDGISELPCAPSTDTSSKATAGPTGFSMSMLQ